MLDSQQTVANVVLDHSACAEVFQKHRIDFCCRGHMTLADAAAAKSVALDALLTDLGSAIASRKDTAAQDPRNLSTPELVAHIVSKHHAYLRSALPFIEGLSMKVSRVHGAHNPKLRDLEAVVHELSESLLAHLDEEEKDLFSSLTADHVNRDEAARLIATMADDHSAIGDMLERVHVATDDFVLPAWACSSYRTLFAELEQLERDTLTHIHLENHVLAPRFTARTAL